MGFRVVRGGEVLLIVLLIWKYMPNADVYSSYGSLNGWRNGLVMFSVVISELGP